MRERDWDWDLFGRKRKKECVLCVWFGWVAVRAGRKRIIIKIIIMGNNNNKNDVKSEGSANSI